jgi:hypothetical protein
VGFFSSEVSLYHGYGNTYIVGHLPKDPVTWPHIPIGKLSCLSTITCLLNVTHSTALTLMLKEAPKGRIALDYHDSAFHPRYILVRKNTYGYFSLSKRNVVIHRISGTNQSSRKRFDGRSRWTPYGHGK